MQYTITHQLSTYFTATHFYHSKCIQKLFLTETTILKLLNVHLFINFFQEEKEILAFTQESCVQVLLWSKITELNDYIKHLEMRTDVTLKSGLCRRR